MPKAQVSKDLFASLTIAARLPALLPHLTKPVERISTGWPLLDYALSEPGTVSGGFVMPSIVVIGAPPKFGKSIWAQHVVQSWVQQGGWCFYWDLENGAKRFIRRLGWRMSKLASNEHTRGLTAEEQKRHDKMVKWITKAGQRMAYQDERRAGPDNIDEWIESAAKAADGEPLIICVDSLQKLPPISGQDRRGSIDTWVRHFEAIRDKYNCVVLVVSELHRGKNYEGGGGSSFKESGDIEYSCDLGMTFSPISANKKVHPRSAYLDIWWDRDGSRDEARIGKYTRVLPYYQIIEEPLKKKQLKSEYDED